MVTFEIISPIGVCVRTFQHETDAKAFVLKRKADLPGLRIDRVETTILRTNVYRPRIARTA
jgi:hypothetical protein